MIVYFDTSAFIPIFIEEPTSAAAERLWDAADRVTSSRLLFAEARAALASARRLGRVNTAQYRQVLGELDQLVSEMDWVEVTEAVVRRAGTLAEDFALRGYDAVHLASAEVLRSPELVVASGDGPLRSAAGSLHLAVAEL